MFGLSAASVTVDKVTHPRVKKISGRFMDLKALWVKVDKLFEESRKVNPFA